MADKILVNVEGVEPFECDEDLYNLAKMVVELLGDAIGDSKPFDAGPLSKALQSELSKLQKPRIVSSEVALKRDWRGVLEGFTMTHQYEDGVTH